MRQVQEFWEKNNVPFAVLFDGGESTQLAWRTGQDSYTTSYCAWHLSYTVGYLWERPCDFIFQLCRLRSIVVGC